MLSLVFACLAITAIAVPTSSPFAPSSDAGEGVEKAAAALLSDWSSDAHKKWAKADNSSHHHNGSHSFPKANCSDATSMYATSTLNTSHASSPPLPTSSTTPPKHTVASQPHSSSSTHTHHSTEPSPVHSTVNGTATPTHPAVENPGGSTPTQPITSSSTPRNTASPTPSLSASAAAYLDPHNTLRAKHSAKALVWSDTLAKAAQDWADKCQWAHSDGAEGNYGENIAAGTGNFAAADAVAAWASEESQYNASNPVYSHYTQMVWKSTTQLGCASASCSGLISPGVAQFHVCEYNPPGNVIGEFGDNVS